MHAILMLVNFSFIQHFDNVVFDASKEGTAMQRQ